MLKRLGVAFLWLLLAASSALAQSRLINMGWEADRLYKNKVTMQFTTPSHPVVITGYNFKLALMPSDPSILPGTKSSQVLWFTSIEGVTATPDDNWGAPKYADPTGGKQNLHGGGLAHNVLVADILKASPWANAVNDFLHLTGLKIPVPANSTILMFAGHAGAGPVDFEVQGGIIYE